VFNSSFLNIFFFLSLLPLSLSLSLLSLSLSFFFLLPFFFLVVSCVETERRVLEREKQRAIPGARRTAAHVECGPRGAKAEAKQAL